MTIRFICDARGRFRKALLDATLARAGGALELALHFGDRDGDFHGACLHRMEVRNGRLGHLMDRPGMPAPDLAFLASPGFQAMVETGVDQMHRMDAAYRYRSHDLHNLQDYLDYYHILADAMAREIEASGASHAVFTNMPHLAYDWVLFSVARAMGLKTLILCQTIFPSRFFSMAAPEDMGFFDPAASAAPPFPIEKGSAPELFFMKDDWQKEGETGRITPGAVVSVMKHLLRRAPARALNPAYVARTLRRVAGIYRTLPKWRDPFATFFHTSEMAYFEHLAGCEGTPVDLDAKFVYVPLHNQPEMSTSSLGGRYRDQLLMIETLARRLPPDWRIYVKENPRQASYARGPMFFHRLDRIPSVTLVPSSANTWALSSRAQFVASVAGTAGWEAIRKGKSAVVFGNSWYKSLPGVFRWTDDLDPVAVAAHTFDHAALEQATGALMARTHPGVIETVYLDNVEGTFDEAANIEAVSATLLDLVTGAQETTFAPDPFDPAHETHAPFAPAPHTHAPLPGAPFGDAP